MNKLTVLLIGLIVIISCRKEENSTKNTPCTKSEESFTNGKGAALYVTSQKWYMEENKIGGVDVGVDISGTIQGDSAAIRTYGDGLIGDARIKLNSKKEFNQNFEIFFTSSPLLSDEYITANTLIMIFSGQDTLKANIKSCSIKNIQFND